MTSLYADEEVERILAIPTGRLHLSIIDHADPITIIYLFPRHSKQVAKICKQRERGVRVTKAAWLQRIPNLTGFQPWESEAVYSGRSCGFECSKKSNSYGQNRPRNHPFSRVTCMMTLVARSVALGRRKGTYSIVGYEFFGRRESMRSVIARVS